MASKYDSVVKEENETGNVYIFLLNCLGIKEEYFSKEKVSCIKCIKGYILLGEKKNQQPHINSALWKIKTLSIYILDMKMEN